jgi:hypothetical protein
VQIGIIGAGRLGRALARRLHGSAHEVMFGGGVSAHEAAAELGASAGSNRAAAKFAEVAVLAVPFAAIDDALDATGSLDGVVLWSYVNALKPDLSGLAVGFDTSAAEEVARRVRARAQLASVIGERPGRRYEPQPRRVHPIRVALRERGAARDADEEEAARRHRLQNRQAHASHALDGSTPSPLRAVTAPGVEPRTALLSNLSKR